MIERFSTYDYKNVHTGELYSAKETRQRAYAYLKALKEIFLGVER